MLQRRRDATTLLCTGPCQGFLRTNVNSVLSVSQSWRCGLWRREDARLSAQEISLLYLVQYVALYYICHPVVRSSTWAQVLAALPDPIGEGMISEAPFPSPLKGAAFVSGCRARPRLSVILAPLGELLKEEDVCLRKLFYFHHSTELCLRYWDDMSQFEKANLCTAVSGCVLLSRVIKVLPTVLVSKDVNIVMHIITFFMQRSFY